MKESKTVQVHLHINVCTKPEIAKKARELIAKRKMNSLMIKLLEEYFKNEPEQRKLF